MKAPASVAVSRTRARRKRSQCQGLDNSGVAFLIANLEKKTEAKLNAKVTLDIRKLLYAAMP